MLELFSIEGSYMQQRYAQNALLYERVRQRCGELLQHFYGSAFNGVAE